MWPVWAASLTLEQALEETRRQHPLLTAADGRIDTAQGLLEQAKLRPNPRLTLQLENLRFGWQGPFSYGNEVDNFAFVTQTLETAKKRQRRTELAQANRRIAEGAKLVLQQELLGQVRQAWWRAAGARNLVAVYDRTQAVLASVVAFHEARVKEGAIAEVDLLRVQLEAEQLTLQRQNALRDQELADIALQRAMGRSSYEPLELPPLTESLAFAEATAEEALNRRAEVQLGNLQISAERANQQLQVALARPNIDAMAGYKHTMGVETLMTGVNIDLAINNRNQGNIAAATASLRTAERELAALRAAITAEVKAALAEVKLRQKQLTTTLPQMRRMAAETARIADAAYREGGTELLRLLDAQRVQLATELLHAQAWTEFESAWPATKRPWGSMKNVGFTVVMGLSLWLAGCGQKAAPAPEATPKEAANKEGGKEGSQGKALEVEMSAEMLRRGDVQSSAVAVLSASASREFAGRLSPNAERSWTVGTVTDGRVVQLLVAVGDRVKKGQVLARVHSHDVHEGRSEYEKAKADRLRATNNLEYAKRNRDRLRRLLELKAASSMQVEEAEAEVRRAEAAVNVAEAELRRTRLHLEEFLEVPAEPSASASSNHEHPENLLQVRAPEAGLITEKLVAQGTLVKANEPMLRLTDTASLWMIASIPEEWLRRVRLGTAATVSVEAFAGENFPARVALIGNEMDRETRTVPVRLQLANPGNRLLPEMYARAAFPDGEVQQQLRVPQDAVHDLDGVSVVFVETAPGRFAPRPLDLGEAANGQVVVRGGLQPGEKVVTKGAYVVKSQLLKARLAEE